MIGFSSALATASRLSSTGASMCTYGAAFGPTASFFMYESGACSKPPRSEMRHHGDRVRQTVRHEIRAFDRIDRDVDLEAAAADFLADEEHRRFVALALADDDAPGDFHLVQRFAHLLDGRAVGGVAFAASHPARSRQRRGFGHFYEVERMDRVLRERPGVERAMPRGYKGSGGFPVNPQNEAFAVSAATRLPQTSRPRSLTSTNCSLRAGSPFAAVVLARADPRIFCVVCADRAAPRRRCSSQLGLLARNRPAASLPRLRCGSATRATFRAERASRSCARCATTSLSWVPFLLLWLTFVLPPQTDARRAASSSSPAATFCDPQSSDRRALQSDRARRADRLRRHARGDHRHRRTRSGHHRPARRARTFRSRRIVLLAVWGRWDAVHYIDIATNGYQGTDMAFFPLYPLLIKIVGGLAGNHLIAGLLISNAAFFFGLLYLYKLVEHEYDRSVARRAIFYVSIFPIGGLLLGRLHRVAVLHADRRIVLLHAYARWWTGGRHRLSRRADARRRRAARRAVRDRMVRAVPKRPTKGRAGLDPALFNLAAGALDPARIGDLHGVPVGAARRSALLLARADSLEPPLRAAVGQRDQRIRQDRAYRRRRRPSPTSRSNWRSRP